MVKYNNQLSIQSAPMVNRKLRSPDHSWLLRQRPFVITPCLIAPVLPGETLKSATFQARCVTEPLLANRAAAIIGWWLEHYFFYVPHGAMVHGEQFKEMMINPAANLSTAADATLNSSWYHPGSGINWVKECMIPVVEHYFRDEGETWDAHMIDGEPIAQIAQKNFWDSVATNVEATAGDFNIDLNANSTITASEAARALTMWEYLRSNNLTEMTYEDYLRAFGVRADTVVQESIPELLRYSKVWQYPSSTVDPVTGIPTSAVSWGVSERLDKDRYFKQPGFIFGVSVARPKVYLGNQRGPGVHLMQDGISWLPIMLRDNDFSSMKQVTKAGSILPTATADGFWIDIADIFVHGDQFLHHMNAADPYPAGAQVMALPAADLTVRYPTEAMVDGLFKDSANPFMSQDGIMRLNILGGIVDTTPRATTVGFNL